jgi:hypothetical protein
VKLDAYNGEQSISAFEWWNHWPVAQIPSSGRPALAADRPGHTSLSHIYWPVSEQDDQHIEKILMTGLTTLEATQPPHSRPHGGPRRRQMSAAVPAFGTMRHSVRMCSQKPGRRR